MIRMFCALLIVVIIAGEPTFGGGQVTTPTPSWKGFYVHTGLIDHLRKFKGYGLAYRLYRDTLRPHVLLVNTDTLTTTIRTGKWIWPAASCSVSFRHVSSAGQNFVLECGSCDSTDELPCYIMTLDPKAAEYIALHETADLAKHPEVYAKIPTKNLDPDFVVQRILNSSILSGIWLDTGGREYVFNSTLLAEWPEAEFEYRFGIDDTTSHDHIVITKGDGKGKRYAFKFHQQQLNLFTMTRRKGNWEPGKRILSLKKRDS